MEPDKPRLFPNLEIKAGADPQAPEPPRILDQLMADLKPAGGSLPPKGRIQIPTLPRPSEPENKEPVPPPPSTAAKPKPEPEEPVSPTPTPPPRPQKEPVLVVEDPPQKAERDAPKSARWLMLAGIVLLVLNLVLLSLVALLWLGRDGVMESWTQPEAPVVAAPAATPTPSPPASPERTAPPPVAPPRETLEPEPFTISKLVLARSVTGFGLYESIPDTPLRARHVPFIQVYVEMENPQAEIRHDNRYVYQFSKAIRLFRTEIGPSEPLMDSAVSLVVSGLSPRRDFHASQALQTSRRLSPGEYTLMVRLTDNVSGQYATRETTFTIHPE